MGLSDPIAPAPLDQGPLQAADPADVTIKPQRAEAEGASAPTPVSVDVPLDCAVTMAAPGPDPGAAGSGNPTLTATAHVRSTSEPAAPAPTASGPAESEPPDAIAPPPPPPDPGPADAIAPPSPPVPARRRPRLLVAVVVPVVAVAVGIGVAAAFQESAGVLRPTGLKARNQTFNSISLTWSRPTQGTLPTRYEVFKDGGLIASVGGRTTAYRVTGLSPAQSYSFRLVAIQDKDHAASKTLSVATTATPPVAAAELTGPYTVTYSHPSYTGVDPYELRPDDWEASLNCASGPCSVELSGRFQHDNAALFHLPEKAAADSPDGTADGNRGQRGRVAVAGHVLGGIGQRQRSAGCLHQDLRLG